MPRKTFFLALLLLLASCLSGVYYWLTTFKPLTLLETIPFSQAIYADKGQLLRLTTTPDGKYRLFTPLANVPAALIQATLLKEDKHFYDHAGVDFAALATALWQSYILQRPLRGASTITMQVVRLRFHLPQHSILGKIKQIILALQIEHYYSKEQILTAYFNLAPYGNNIEGIAAASLIYYHQNVAKLTLPQALALSVVPQNPSKHNLNSLDYPGLIPARDHLAQRWLAQFPQDEKLQALFKLPLAHFTRHQVPFYAPHFVTTVLKETAKNQFNIATSLNLSLQTILEKSLHDYLALNKAQGFTNAAALLIDIHTMAVKAWVGSANFFADTIAGQIDGVLTQRSPGSTLKPFIYALALDQGLIHPATVLTDAPMSFGNYNPENFDYQFLGPIKAQDALILSRNIPAIDLANQLQHPTFYEFLAQTGLPLRSEKNLGLSLVLGGAEISMRRLVELYAMLGNQGIYQTLKLIPNANSAQKRLLSAEASFLVLDMLRQNPPLKKLSINPDLPIAWKTGTSSGYRDAWAIAVFSHYVLAIWIGNFSGRGHPTFIGRTAAAPLLFNSLAALAPALAPLPDTFANWPPLNLIRLNVCTASGLLPTPACPHTTPTWFIPGKSPIQQDTIHRAIMINPATGLRTCQVRPQNQFVVYEFWPSAMAKIFQQAGIRKKSPPAFEPGCDPLTDLTTSGKAPQILSPKSSANYLPAPKANTAKVPFSASVDADVTIVHWFANQHYLGKSVPQQIVWFPLKAGHYTIRAVDNFGRVNTQTIQVTNLSTSTAY